MNPDRAPLHHLLLFLVLYVSAVIFFSCLAFTASRYKLVKHYFSEKKVGGG